MHAGCLRLNLLTDDILLAVAMLMLMLMLMRFLIS